MTTYVAGSGVHHPEQRLTNADLAARAGVTDAWIRKYLGIRERRKAPDDWRSSDLGAASVRAAIEASGWALPEIDLLLCATSTPDALAPSTACILADKLGISPPCFDLNAACAGFVYGLGVAAAMIDTGRYRRVALVAADNYTRFTDYDESGLSMYWGDGGACVLLQPEPAPGGLELIDWDIGAMTEGGPHAGLPVAGFTQQNAPEVKEYALRGFVESATGLLARNHVGPGDLTAFVGHQANYRLLQQVAGKLGIPGEKHWHTVQLYGNRGVAGAPATLIRKSEERPLEPGQLVLVTVIGAGFTTASALLRGCPGG